MYHAYYNILVRIIRTQDTAEDIYMKKIKNFISKKPVLSSFLAAEAAGAAFPLLYIFLALLKPHTDSFLYSPASVYYSITGSVQAIWSSMLIMGPFVFYPLILTLVNFVSLFILPRDITWKKHLKKFEYITLSLGAFYNLIIIWGSQILGVAMHAEWHEVVYNSQRHQPMWTDAGETVKFLWVVGIVGYLVLSFCRLENMPPLVIVLSISAMYLGVSQCVMWCIQIFEAGYLISYVLCLLPFNGILIAMKTIRYKIAEWNLLKDQDKIQITDRKILSFLDRYLQNAACWPVAALLLALPLLGIILCILTLFGQRPDDIIKAWTETADWRLSEHVGPPNADASEHYLCTVAAGGHTKIVKPLRMGERRGHRVVVNRQLCIANAFEQIIEEKTPRFHYFIRRIYDTYGLPLSRLIRTKLAADIVYVLMKPLEWFFLTVIYLCDVKPENRIAVQYLPPKQTENAAHRL